MLTNKLRLVFGILVLAGSALALTGVVLDKFGKQISRVKVELLADGSTISTGSDGSFTLLPAGAEATQEVIGKIQVALVQGILQFTLPQSVIGSMRTMDMKGTQVNSMPSQHLSAGSHQYNPLGNTQAASGIYLVEYMLGSQKGVLKLAVSSSLLNSGNKSNGVTRVLRLTAQGALDSVKFSKSGYASKSVAIVDYSDNLGTVTLEGATASSVALISSSSSTLTAQTITFTAPSNKIYGDAAFALSATATSGLGVTFASATTGVCVVSGITISILSAGSCVIGASQVGDVNYSPAADVVQTITIAPKSVTAVIDAQTKVYGTSTDPALTYTPSGLLGSDVLTGSLSRVAGENVGNYPITGTLSNPNYSVTYTGANLTITKATPSITITNPGTKDSKTDASAFALVSTILPPTGAAVSYSVGSSTACSVSTSGLVSFVSDGNSGYVAGDCSITVSQAANANGSAATQTASFRIDGMLFPGRTLDQNYRTVKIGTQTWMAENLNYGTQLNGTPTGSNQNDNSQVEKYCYGDDVASCAADGGLYQWAEAMLLPSACLTASAPGCGGTVNSSLHQGLCPAGWHIPKSTEWNTLASYLNGYTVAGGALKTTGTTQWSSPNTSATNSSGFSALPAGYRGESGGFGQHGNTSFFWEANESSPTTAFVRDLESSNESLYPSNITKTTGVSVRCLLDPVAPAPTFTLNSGTFTSAQTTTITSTISGADIHYTTDGSMPTFASALYVGAIDVKGSQTIKAITIASGYAISAVNSADYVVNLVDTRNSTTQTYKTVTIGSQTWMAENLNIGTKVPSSDEQNQDGVIEKYCYSDDVNNCSADGGLYQWAEALALPNACDTSSLSVCGGTINTNNHQGICPSGWHIPSSMDWNTLITYLGGGSIAGGKMKTTGTSQWFTPNLGATNSSAFSALPIGIRLVTGGFNYRNDYAYFWEIDDVSDSDAYFRILLYSDATVSENYYAKGFGRSVRCIMN